MNQHTNLLLQNGADVNKPLYYEDTIMSLLYFAVYNKQDIIMVGSLLNHGANVNLGKEGWTPLMAATLLHNESLVYLLIENKPDLNLKGIHGWTALHFAARENNPEIAKALLKAGASKEARDEWKRTPMNVAYENDKKESLKAIRSY